MSSYSVADPTEVIRPSGEFHEVFRLSDISPQSRSVPVLAPRPGFVKDLVVPLIDA